MRFNKDDIADFFDDHFLKIFFSVIGIVVIALIVVIKVDQANLKSAKENGTIEIIEFEVTNSAQTASKDGYTYKYTLGVYHSEYGAHVIKNVPENIWAQYGEGSYIALAVNTYEYGEQVCFEVSLKGE